MLDIECTDLPTQTGLDIVGLDEMKSHLKAEDSAADNDVTAAINEAVGYLDGIGGILNRTLMPRTWTLYRRCFPRGDIIELPYPPILSVASVQYMDTTGTLQTLDPMLYLTRLHKAPGEIEIIKTGSWPATYQHPRAVQITYDAGYEVYPANLARAVKFLAAHYFANPSAVTRGQANQTSKLEFGLDYLLSGLIVPHAYGASEGDDNAKSSLHG